MIVSAEKARCFGDLWMGEFVRGGKRVKKVCYSARCKTGSAYSVVANAVLCSYDVLESSFRSR